MAKKAARAAATPKAKNNDAPPGPGHNENGGISDADMAKLFNTSMEKLQRLITAKDQAVKDIRNHRKVMKNDGFEPYEIDYALELARLKEDDAYEQHQRKMRIARWTAHPIGTQANMFEEVPTNGSVPRVAPEELGRLAGSQGAVCKPPANLAQDDAQRWITGWQAGQAAMAGAGIKAPKAAPDFQ